jgi:hypothetical protein
MDEVEGEAVVIVDEQDHWLILGTAVAAVKFCPAWAGVLGQLGALLPIVMVVRANGLRAD